MGFVDYIWAWLLAERHSTDTETLDWHCIIPNMLTLFAKSRYQIVIKINYRNKISIRISTRYRWTQLQSVYSDSNYFQSDYFQWNSSIYINVYRIQPRQKEATKTITLFVSNTQSNLSQSNIMKIRNIFQCNGNLLTFPFKTWLTFLTFPF